MITVLADIHRRTDLRVEQFRDYYENRHVPLALQWFDFARYYRMHVIDTAGDDSVLAACFSVFGYRDQAHMQQIFELVQGPAKQATEADEEAFMDRARNRFRVVSSHDGPARGGACTDRLMLFDLPAELLGETRDVLLGRTRRTALPPAITLHVAEAEQGAHRAWCEMACEHSCETLLELARELPCRPIAVAAIRQCVTL